jgi:hypothetical protein
MIPAREKAGARILFILSGAVGLETDIPIKYDYFSIS